MSGTSGLEAPSAKGVFWGTTVQPMGVHRYGEVLMPRTPALPWGAQKKHQEPIRA